MKQPSSENELIKSLTGKWSCSPQTIHGVGDDCAVLKNNSRLFTLLKTDAIVEGYHFTAQDPPQKIGHKAIARVVSDFAAMGGIPQSALITLFLPQNFKYPFIRKVYQGMEKTAQKYQIDLVGGETTRAAQFALSIATIGVVEKRFLVLRKTAQAGDLIYVTGSLGGSIRGKHLRFTPRQEESQWLVKNFKPTAMMDISDGLAADLPRLAQASRLGYSLDLDNIPCNQGVSLHQALNDGEDYELLFTIPPSISYKLAIYWKTLYPKLRLTCVGKMLSNRGVKNLKSNYGFDHIRNK